MADVFVAFSAIWAVTGIGWLVGRFGLLGPGAETVLARLVFFVATPALLFVTLSASSVSDLVSPALATYVISSVVLAAATVAVARLVWRLSPGESVIAALSSSYVNAANLGIPVAAYVFGDFAVVAPVLLFQLLLASPLAMAVLEITEPAVESGAAPDPQVNGDAVATMTPARTGLGARLLLLPVRNPIILASAVGLAFAVLAWHPYADVLRPLQLLGQAAVPTALLALGLSLGAGRGPNGQAPLTPRARVSPRVAVATLVGLKLVAQPVIAFLVGRYGFGLQGRVLLGSVVMSGLPTAQNVFVYASRYRQGVGVARDSVIVSTVVAFLTLGVFTQLLA